MWKKEKSEDALDLNQVRVAISVTFPLQGAKDSPCAGGVSVYFAFLLGFCSSTSSIHSHIHPHRFFPWAQCTRSTIF